MTPIIAAIIGSAGMVLGPLVTLLITRYLDNRDKLTLSTGRRAVINGQWKGTLNQIDGRSGTAPMTITFVAKRKKVYGVMCIQYPGNNLRPAYDDEPAADDQYTFEGGFLYERYLRLNYVAKTRHRIQFGSIILELTPSGEKLSGKLVGYGAFSKSIVSGNIELQRAALSQPVANYH